MKILVTHPKVGSAIERLATMNAKYMPHHEFRFAEVHPKRPDPEQLQRFIEAYEWCDIWDAQYWKTAEKLQEIFPGQLDKKPSILTHHNPYDLLKSDWSHYTQSVVMNRSQQKVLPDSILIPHAVDFDERPWNPDYTERQTVLMVAQRIESKKGIEPVARACKELGYQFVLVGEISDAEYFAKIAQHRVTFMEKISDEELAEVWKQAAIHVCNSVDNFESGTLPILDAMATGVPVLTRPVGLVPDIYNEKNLRVREGQPDDYEELKAMLQGLMDDRIERLRMRDEAWQSVRNYEAERRARLYSSLYYRLGYHNTLVSVILPVFGHPERLERMLKALDAQSYPAIEIVIVSDGDPSYDSLAIKSKHTVKYFRVGDFDRYGLGYARDYGAMEAEGEILVFLDERFIPDPEMINEFASHLHPKQWLFGNKNGKRTFVENVSCLYRQEFIDLGMSNQLIDRYGGMSQELRTRSKRQGFKQIFIEKAIARPEYASHNYNSKKVEIREMKQRLWKMGMS